MSDHIDWEQFLENQEAEAMQGLTIFDPLILHGNTLQALSSPELELGYGQLNTGSVQSMVIDPAELPSANQNFNNSNVTGDVVNNAFESSLISNDSHATADDAQTFNPQMSFEDWQMFHSMADLSKSKPNLFVQHLNLEFGCLSEPTEYTTPAPIYTSEAPLDQPPTLHHCSNQFLLGSDFIQPEVPISHDASSMLPPSFLQHESVAQDSTVDEKPKALGGRRDARINTATHGGTSRTKKINSYQPTESYPVIHPHPFKSLWYTANNKVFSYTRYNELEETTFSFTRLYEFIRQHPSRGLNNPNGAKLTLYIQKGPADSTRRYPTTQSDKCRFADCPSRKHGFHGTIAVGHFRVAFDELSYSYGEETDPFLCAGYVHLYCLERFMHLPDICRMANIQVIADNRTLRKEPKATFRARLEGNVYAVVANFIDACKGGTLDDIFPGYPQHVVRKDSSGKRFVEPKDYTKTLNYALQKAVMPDRSKIAKNAAKPGTLAATFGDLEVQLGARRNHYTAGKNARRARKRARDDESEDEDDDLEGGDEDEWQPSPKKARR